MLRLLKGYLVLTGKRNGWRSIVYGIEDIIQEASIVLWKVLLKYPKATPEEITKIFMVSLRRHLGHIFKKEDMRHEKFVHSLDNLLGHASDGRGKMEDRVEIQEVILLRDGGRPMAMLPWDYYEMKLRLIAKKIGKAKLRSFIHEGRKANTEFVEKRKEEVMTVIS